MRLLTGQIKLLLEQIVLVKSLGGDPILQKMTKVKLLMKGIQFNNFDENSPDDPELIEKISLIAKDFGLDTRFIDDLSTVGSK